MADESITDIDSIQDCDLPVITLGNFLEDISLLSAVDVKDDEESSNKIALMTVHSSKGLEFPYVYVAGMEENIFPSGGMFASPSDIEEERRLFYVALTRAKVAVNLSFAKTRMRNGKHEENSPSRFVKEIDMRYVDNPISDDECGTEETVSGFSGFGSRFGSNRFANAGSYGSRYGKVSSGVNSYGTSGPVKTEPSYMKPAVPSNLKPVRSLPVNINVDSNFEPVSVLDLKVGQRVEHNRFGFGKILEITGNDTAKKARIDFEKYGEKVLLLNYAKIRLAK